VTAVDLLLLQRLLPSCVQEVFSCEPLRAVEQLRRTDVIPPALLSDYQKLLSSQVGRRLNPAKVCA
jgi:SCY1-like protein 1